MSVPQYPDLYAVGRRLISADAQVLAFGDVKDCMHSVRCLRDRDVPTACFTVNPIVGIMATLFNVDASGSSDFQDPTSVLQVRWDWEGDGTYDTDWTTTKTATHQYSTIGTKTIKLEVRDTGDLTHTQTHQVTVFDESTTVIDIDGNVYQTVTIGDQDWMVENLKVTHYRNGDPIPHVTVDSDWWLLETGAYCNYDNNVNNVATYGRLYNWYAVDDIRNIAPAGWHVPTDAEWNTLVNYLGGDEVAGGKMKTTGTIQEGTGLWYSPNTGATNSSGFTALPAGFHDYNGGFYSLGGGAFFWSSTEYDSSRAWDRSVGYDGSDVDRDDSVTQNGFSVRCVRDDIDAPTASFTIDPLSGTTATVFNVDASGSSDLEDPISALQVRWDWEGDGTYDTDWSTTKTAFHQYSTVGMKTIKLEVKDTEGLTDMEAHRITVFTGCGTVTDIDGNTYQTVQIGDQCWMTENLKVTHYRNGDPIPNVTNNPEWNNLSTGAYCNYSNDINNAETYGRLYNWFAVNDSRGLAPEGWHVPSAEEWKELEMYLGMSQSQADSTGTRGTDEGGKLKETGYSHWGSPNTGATNESGFSALPAGYRLYDGSFYGLGYYAAFWSASEYLSYAAWGRRLYYGSSGVVRYGYYKELGFSVRCLRDNVRLE